MKAHNLRLNQILSIYIPIQTLSELSSEPGLKIVNEQVAWRTIPFGIKGHVPSTPRHDCTVQASIVEAG